jgi:hypothetical protein
VGNYGTRDSEIVLGEHLKSGGVGQMKDGGSSGIEHIKGWYHADAGGTFQNQIVQYPWLSILIATVLSTEPSSCQVDSDSMSAATSAAPLVFCTRLNVNTNDKLLPL